MRFPFRALFRIVPVSPISDVRPPTAIYGSDLLYPCFANTTSGTFDPNIRFSGQDIQTGSFGDLIDVWINATSHRNIRNRVDESNTPFNATLMLRLFALYERIIRIDDQGVRIPFDRSVNLLNNTEAIGGNMFEGFSLAKMRIYPTLTSLTFEVKRTKL